MNTSNSPKSKSRINISHCDKRSFKIGSENENKVHYYFQQERRTIIELKYTKVSVSSIYGIVEPFWVEAKASKFLISFVRPLRNQNQKRQN